MKGFALGFVGLQGTSVKAVSSLCQLRFGCVRLWSMSLKHEDLRQGCFIRIVCHVSACLIALIPDGPDYKLQRLPKLIPSLFVAGLDGCPERQWHPGMELVDDDFVSRFLSHRPSADDY